MKKEAGVKILSLATGLLVAFAMIFTAEKIGTVYTMGEAPLLQKDVSIMCKQVSHVKVID